ncbi:hypothetical protein [Sphingomonas sp. PP-CE-1A-559]|uniref:hypothetical protein n=1 Tax=Sphingomonas sp. PP-CE-1A-559 TaxID=2135657 RepID=UPI001056B191|nr:hypothetical protein [Sphingomonas sp. PP-CE-1A-559]
MANLITWLETHQALSGWAQFAGAIIALAITYFTAFAPHWQRRKQLKNAAGRLLQNSYEVIESYHRTSANFLPTALSVRAAGLSMISVASEIDRFPIFELRNQGPRSAARNLVASGSSLKLLNLFLESIAIDLVGREGTPEEREHIRALVFGQLKLIEDMITGKELQRPVWPVQ